MGKALTFMALCAASLWLGGIRWDNIRDQWLAYNAEHARVFDDKSGWGPAR